MDNVGRMVTKFLTRQVQVIISDGTKDLLFYQVFINGDSGTIYGLTGRGIAMIDDHHLEQLHKYTGCTSFDAIMSDKVIELLLKTLPKRVNVVNEGSFIMADGLKVNKVNLALTGI